MKNFKTIMLVTLLITGCSLFLASEVRNQAIPQSSIMEISGNIQAIMTDIPVGPGGSSGGPAPFVKVKIKDSKTGQEHSVQIAPGHFLRTNGVSLKANDLIKIKAFRLQGLAELKSLSIETNGKIVNIRDKYGKGLWVKPDFRTSIKDNKER